VKIEAEMLMCREHGLKRPATSLPADFDTTLSGFEEQLELLQKTMISQSGKPKKRSSSQEERSEELPK
jgi:hypothetical protein